MQFFTHFSPLGGTSLCGCAEVAQSPHFRRAAVLLTSSAVARAIMGNEYGTLDKCGDTLSREKIS